MLKIIKVPDESTFTEADLKPGLRVIRKRDGAECVVIDDGDQGTTAKCYALLSAGSLVAYEGDTYGTCHPPNVFVMWLNRDFRRVEEPPQYKTVGEVPVGVMFDTAHYRGLIRVKCIYTNHNIVHTANWQADHLIESAPVTRVYCACPLTIDPSVTEGV